MNPAPRVVYAYDAFISYSRKDSEVVESICRILEDEEGLTIWKDTWELAGGDDWIEVLPEAIACSRSLVTFIGPSGMGPWHREETKVALRRAVEHKTVRVVPVALQNAPDPLDVPEFLGSRQIVDMRTIDAWTIRLLRCAIVGARPGRRELPSPTTPRTSRLYIQEWDIACTRADYKIHLRVGNAPQSKATIIVRSALVRVHRVAHHPIAESLDVYLAPIGTTSIKRVLVLPREPGVVWEEFSPHRQLSPGELEDVQFAVDVPEGLRTTLSFGVHYQIVEEPVYRLAETGYAAIGRRGRPGVAPAERDTYVPGQHNLDMPKVIPTPDWPFGWPQPVSQEEWEYYGSDEAP
jgi:TIR domain